MGDDPTHGDDVLGRDLRNRLPQFAELVVREEGQVGETGPLVVEPHLQGVELLPLSQGLTDGDIAQLGNVDVDSRAPTGSARNVREYHGSVPADT